MGKRMGANGNNVRPWHFQRGLSDDFVEELRKLAKTESSWFRDVLTDKKLIIGIRKNYLDIYCKGQRIFQVSWNKRDHGMKITTHPKFLVDPALRKPVSFDGKKFCIRGISPLISSYEQGKTLGKMKTAAEIYSGVEKQGVHAIFDANPGVVDIEVALSRSADQEERVGHDETDSGKLRRRKAERIDIACFEPSGEKVHLHFWEAKHYSNGELWASGNTLPPVVGQVSRYKELIKKYRNDILKSYRTVANNLVEIAKMTGREEQLSKLIRRVAAGAELVADEPPEVGVAIFGFGKADGAGCRHKRMIEKLQGEGLAVAARGEARGMKLIGR
jgi:hypothetical protein